MLLHLRLCTDTSTHTTKKKKKQNIRASRRNSVIRQSATVFVHSMYCTIQNLWHTPRRRFRVLCCTLNTLHTKYGELTHNTISMAYSYFGRLFFVCIYNK